MDVLTKLLSNPLILGGILAGLVVLVLVLAWALLRGRKGKAVNDAHIRSELLSMERENQFSYAVSQVEFQDSPQLVASHIASLCREYLSLPVFRIYAGRESDNDFTNILPKSGDAIVTNDLAQSSALPASLPATLALGYTRPQAININVLIGPAATGTGQGATIVPWRGAFGWGGLLVAGAMNSNPADVLAGSQDALSLLGNKLAVALELEANRLNADSHPHRSDHKELFYQTTLRAVDGQATLQDFIQTVTGLVEAESASLWMFDTNTQMLRVEESFGLKSTEFLPLPLGQGLAGNVFETSTPLALADAPSDPRCIFPREAKESGIGSYLGVPVKVEDQVVGVLEVHTDNSRYWTDREVEILESAASTLSIVLKNQFSGSRHLKVEGAYVGLSEALQRLRTTDELMEAIVEVFGNALGVSRAVILDLDEAKRPVTIRHEFKTPDVVSATGTVFSDGAVHDMTYAIVGNNAVAASDVGLRSFMGEDIATKLDIVSELAVAIRENGTTSAILLLHQCDRPRLWNADEIEFTNRVSRHLALSLEQISVLQQARAAGESIADPSLLASVKNGQPMATRSSGVLDVIPEAVIILDQEGHLEYFNQSAGSELGLREADLGKAVTSVDALTLGDETIWQQILASRSVERFETTQKRSIAAAQTATSSSQPSEAKPQPIRLSVAPSIAGMPGRFVVTLSHLNPAANLSSEAEAHLSRLKEQQQDIEQKIAEARAAELQARARIERLNSLEGTAREGGVAVRRLEEEMMAERERHRTEKVQMQDSLQQLLDTNKLKSEFLVSTGRELEVSLQSTMEVAARLASQDIGQLSVEQQVAIREILTRGKQLKENIQSLIEYGSARAR